MKSKKSRETVFSLQTLQSGFPLTFQEPDQLLVHKYRFYRRDLKTKTARCGGSLEMWRLTWRCGGSLVEMWWLIGIRARLLRQRSRVWIRHLPQWSWGAAGSLCYTVKTQGTGETSIWGRKSIQKKDCHRLRVCREAQGFQKTQSLTIMSYCRYTFSNSFLPETVISPQKTDPLRKTCRQLSF